MMIHELKNIKLFGIIGLVVTFAACDSNNAGTESDITTEEIVQSVEAQAEAEDEFASAFEYVDDEISNLEETSSASKAASATMAAADTFSGTENLPDCAIVTRDTTEQMVTIDFGDGCEGEDGVVRSGQIIVTFDGNFREAGATTTATLQNFTANDRQIEGSLSITYNGEGNGYTREVSGGQLTNGNGTFSFNSTKTVVRTEGAGTFRTHDDRYEVTGSREGNTFQDVSFSSEITSPLIKKRGSVRCRRNFAAGIVEITIGDRNAMLDYGDGSCDRKATLTINGETREIILR